MSVAAPTAPRRTPAPPAGVRRWRRPDPAVWALVAAVLLTALAAGASVAVTPLGPIGVLGGAALMVAIRERPVVAAVVVAGIVPAIAGLSRSVVGIAGFKLSELLLVACLGALLLRRPTRWRSMSGADWALIAFSVTGAFFGVFHATTGTSSLDSMLRVGLQPTFLFLAWWTASRAVERREDLTLVMRWMLLVSTVPAAVAVLQFFDVPGVRSALISVTSGELAAEAGSEFSRVTGPFPIWHSLGGYLLVPTVLAIVLVLRGDRGVLPRRLLFATLIVDSAALFLSVTVTILLWLPVAVFVAALVARRLTRAFALLAALVLAASLAFPTVLLDRVERQLTPASGTSEGIVPQTLAYRFLIWERDYLPLMERAAGAGLGNDLPDSVFFTSTENQYITYALRGGGALVVAALVAVGAMTVRALRHARRAEGAARSAALACLGVLAFLPAAAMVWPYLTNAGLGQVLFGFGGAALAMEPVRRATGYAPEGRTARSSDAQPPTTGPARPLRRRRGSGRRLPAVGPVEPARPTPVPVPTR